MNIEQAVLRELQMIRKDVARIEEEMGEMLKGLPRNYGERAEEVTHIVRESIERGEL